MRLIAQAISLFPHHTYGHLETSGQFQRNEQRAVPCQTEYQWWVTCLGAPDGAFLSVSVARSQTSGQSSLYDGRNRSDFLRSAIPQETQVGPAEGRMNWSFCFSCSVPYGSDRLWFSISWVRTHLSRACVMGLA